MRNIRRPRLTLWACLITILLVLVTLMGCTSNDDDNGGGGGGGKTVTMDSLELLYDWDPYQRGFDSLQVGDTLHLEDTIKNIRVEKADTMIYLGYITIKVLGTEIKNELSVYDKVRITLTVISVKLQYDDENADFFEGYVDNPYKTYSYEWFKEDENGFSGGIVIRSTAIMEI